MYPHGSTSLIAWIAHTSCLRKTGDCQMLLKVNICTFICLHVFCDSSIGGTRNGKPDMYHIIKKTTW